MSHMNCTGKLAVVVATVLTGLATMASDSRELFNGRDLTGWYKYLQGRGTNNDPNGVITVTNGVIRISGEEFGCLTTAEDFSDYRLTVEYRFLGTRFGPKKDKALDSGILFHSVGEDGGFGGIWMASHEYNIIVGASGDFWTVHPKGSNMYLKAETAKHKLGAHRIWQKGGQEVTITGNDRICRCDISPTWTDTSAAEPAANENPVGEWNTAVLECCGDRVDCFFNGKHVNHATCVFPSRGKIQLQSEGCGIEFRRITLERFGTDLERMSYNNPSATVDLENGIWTFPYVFDWDGDGSDDILLATGSKPYSESLLYRRDVRDGKFSLLMERGMCVDRVFHANGMQSEYAGKTVLMKPGYIEWAPQNKSPFDFRRLTPPGGRFIPHFRRLVGASWCFADLDGDGREDIVAGVGDWSDYGRPGPGCPAAYDAKGNWTNDQLQVYMYWFRNKGGEAPDIELESAQPLLCDGKPLFKGPWGRPSPMIRDWDGDGDLDIICGEFVDSFWYFENIGTAKEARFAAARKVQSTDGGQLAVELCMFAPTKADWNGDGKPDLVINNWNAMVYENVGAVDGVTRFKTYNSVARYQLSGHTTCPTAVDFDGNGIPDLVICAEDGQFYYIENQRSANARMPDQLVLQDEAREFDGRTRFHLPRSEALVPSRGDFTISMEVRCGDAARWGEQHLFSSHAPVQWRGVGGMGSLGLNFEGKDRGRPYFYYRLGGLLKAKTDITDDKWHVLTLVRKSGVFSLAVDGRIEATATCADSFCPIEGWALGANAYIEEKDVGNFYRGWMRNVRLLQHAEDAASVGVKTLARRGEKSEYSIVLPPSPSPSQGYAAKQFRFILEKLTGVYLPIVADRDFKGGKAVYLGRDPGGTGDLGTDGNRLVVRGDDLYVVGSPVRGTLYGIYELLETYGDAGWYEWDRVNYPRQNSFAVPADLDWTDLPTLMMRDPCGWEAIHNPDIAAYWRFNGAGNGHPHAPKAPAHLGGCSYWFPKGNSAAHTFLSLVPPKKYFATHPEYFSEINGVRRNGITQLCLTNPDVLRIATEEVLRMLDAEPMVEFVGVSANDWKFNCTCKNCKAIDDYEESPAGTLIRFVNAIAEEVEKKHPKVYVQTLAYLHTRKAPKHVRPRHNVVPTLCPIECDFGHPLKTGVLPNNVNFRKDMDAWAAITDKLYIWDYVTNFGWFMGAQPNIFVMQENMKYFRDNRTAFLYADGPSFNAEFAALKSYLVGKWAWNPDLSADRLIDRFLTGSYGSAAPHVREYIDLVQDVAKRHPRHFFGCFSSVHPEFSSAAFADKSRDLWSKAEREVAGNAAVLKRLRRAEFSPVAMRLDAAAKKTKYIWVTRHPETFAKPTGVDDDLSFAEARIEEFRKDGHQTVFGGPVQAKERSIYGGWRRMADFTRPKEGCDRVLVGLDDLTVYHEDWGKIVDDQTAFQGKAYLSYNTQDLLTLLIRFGNVAYDSGVRYAIRVRVRAELEQGAKGEVFCATLGRMEKAVMAKEVRDDQWHWYDVGAAELSDALEFQFRPGRFANGGGRSTVRNLYVDQVEIARAAGD